MWEKATMYNRALTDHTSCTNYKLFVCQDANEPEDESFVRSGQSL